MVQLVSAYILLAIFFSLEFIFRKGKKAKNINKTTSDNKSTAYIGLTFFIILIISLLANIFKIGVFNNPKIADAGLLIMIVGLLMRIWSMLTLKKYYTRTLVTIEQQPLIKKGPYYVIRHPGYLGTILIWCAAGLAMHNIVMFTICTPLIIICYTYRIHIEEKMLQEQFGEQYFEYKKNSWKVFPLIW